MRRFAPPPQWTQSVMPQRTQGSWLDGPSQPGPTQEEMLDLRNSTIGPATPPLRLKPEVATKLLITSLRDSQYLRVTIQALEPSTQHLYSCSDLPFQVFHHLDQELFRGTLTGNVHLAISKLPRSYPGVTSRHGRLGPRIRIQLAQELVDRGAHAHLLAALLHQMIHAYLLQCCGHRNVGVQANGYDLCHDYEFSSLLYAIQRRLELPHRLKFPSLWCNTGAGLRRPRRSDLLEQEAGSSHCFLYRHPIFSSDDCEFWKTTLMDKVPLPRSPPPVVATPPSNESNPRYSIHPSLRARAPEPPTDP